MKETQYHLKNLYKLIRFKPDNKNVFKDIHKWRYQVIRGQLAKTRAVLKITHNFNPEGYFQLLNEITADNLLKRFEHKDRKRAPHYRRVLMTGSNSSFTWLAKEFVGDPLGISWFVINPKFKKNQRALINKAFNELERLHKIPYPEFRHFITQRFPSVDHDTIKRRLKRIYLHKEEAQSLNFYLEKQHILGNKKVFIHGDFIISNLIVSRGIVYLTDFEFISAEHPMTDLATLWRFSQLNLPIRKEIIKRFIKTKDDENNFLIALARDILYHLIGIGVLGHKITSEKQRFMEETAIAEFLALSEGVSSLLKLAEQEAKKYASLERELIDSPYKN